MTIEDEPVITLELDNHLLLCNDCIWLPAFKEAFRDYGNNSFFLTDAGKYPNLRMEFESLHLGMYDAMLYNWYDGFTGLFYPESEEIKEKKRTIEKSGTKIFAVAGFPILFGMKMEIIDLSNP